MFNLARASTTHFGACKQSQDRIEKLRGEKILHDKLFERVKEGKVDIRWNTTLEEVTGERVVTAATLKREGDGQIEDLAVDGVFIAIGPKPATAAGAPASSSAWPKRAGRSRRGRSSS